ncbi:MAG: MFS transporter [Candidatus Gastranaerophilales bacterium]|nr:MFS transporter [Candidatus Gastranaerophilales bacterium]
MRNKNQKAVNWLSTGHFVLDAYSGFLNPILPFIAANLGISMAIASLMVSASNLTASLSQPLFGFIADKWKKRFFIFWGMLFASIFLSLIGIAPTPWILALCIILGSMGVSFFHPQATSFAAFFAGDDNNSTQMSKYIAAGTIGYAIGPLISSGITDHFGLHSLPFAAIFGVLLAFSMFFFIPKLSLVSTKKTEFTFFGAFSDMFKNRTVRILIMTSILKSLIVSSFCLILPFYWKNLGFNATKIGFILFVFMLLGGLGIVASPYIEKLYGAKRVFYLSMMFVFPLSLLFYFAELKMPVFAVIPLFIIGFVSFLSVPLNMVMAQKTMPQYNSMISGFIGGFSWGVVGLLLPLITLLAEKFGILNVLLCISLFPFALAYFVKYLPEEY